MSTSFNIISLFINAALKNPDKTAIIYRNEYISYGELLSKVKITAAFFKQKGISKGDNVLLFVPMSTDLYRNILSLFYIGAIPVFVDDWVSVSRMEECCKIVKPKALIGPLKIRILSFFSKEMSKIRLKLSSLFKSYICPLDSFEPSLKSDTALITFTTGSTGTPKAAKRTHSFLLEQFNILIEKINPVEEDVSATTLPIVLLINLGIGNTSVITGVQLSQLDTSSIGTIYTQLKNLSVNRLTGSPVFIKKLADYMLLNNLQLSSVKKIFTGGAPVYRRNALLFTQAFPDADIEIIYGSTEAEPISSIEARELITSPVENDFLGLNIGKINPHTSVRIIPLTNDPIPTICEKNFKKLFLDHGETGEIIVSGPHVLKEYINNPEAFRLNKIRIGNTIWHRTGDSGFMSADGNLFLTGRCNALVRSKEKLLSPFVYENILQNIENVEEGALCLYKDKMYVVLQLTSNADKVSIESKIRQWNALSDSQIIYIRKMPKDPRHSSKIEYSKLTRLLHKLS